MEMNLSATATENTNNEMMEGEKEMEEIVCAYCGAIIEDKESAIQIGDEYFCDEECAHEADYYRCESCGEWGQKCDMIDANGHIFCDEECAANEGWHECDYCGNWIHEDDDSVMEIGDQYFCDDDCAMNAGYERCYECGDWASPDDMTYIENEDVYVCDDCRDRYFTCCDRCGEWVRDSDIYETANGDSVCESCRNDYYVCCDNCGDLIDIDDAIYDDEDDCYYCEDCYNVSGRGRLCNYSYKPAPHFYCDETETEIPVDKRLNMGVENEIDNGDLSGKFLEELGDVCGDHAYFKHDGSLSSDGVEIVTHPCTLKYYENHFPIYEMCEKAREYDYKSHDTSTCGLHVHVNRTFFGDGDERDLNIAKVILIVDRFWDNYIVPFTRRQMSKLERWGAKVAVNLYEDETDTTKTKKVISAQRGSGRYVAVNLQNRNTIEFRIFRGTLKPETILATLQFVDTICRFVKGISINEIDNLKWMDLFKDTTPETHPELHAYLKERDIYGNDKTANVIHKKRKLSTESAKLREETLARHFKIGDHVIIRNWEDMERDAECAMPDHLIMGSGVHFVDKMREYCGEELILCDGTTIYGSPLMRYRLRDPNGEYIGYFFTVEMFNCIPENN